MSSDNNLTSAMDLAAPTSPATPRHHGANNMNTLPPDDDVESTENEPSGIGSVSSTFAASQFSAVTKAGLEFPDGPLRPPKITQRKVTVMKKKVVPVQKKPSPDTSPEAEASKAARKSKSQPQRKRAREDTPEPTPEPESKEDDKPTYEYPASVQLLRQRMQEESEKKQTVIVDDDGPTPSKKPKLVEYVPPTMGSNIDQSEAIYSSFQAKAPSKAAMGLGPTKTKKAPVKKDILQLTHEWETQHDQHKPLNNIMGRKKPATVVDVPPQMLAPALDFKTQTSSNAGFANKFLYRHNQLDVIPEDQLAKNKHWAAKWTPDPDDPTILRKPMRKGNSTLVLQGRFIPINVLEDAMGACSSFLFSQICNPHLVRKFPVNAFAL